MPDHSVTFLLTTRGPQCLLVVQVTFQLTGLWSGCSLGSVAILTVALRHHFLISSRTGRRYTQAFRASVGDVRRPPVMASTPALWMLLICLMTLVEPIVFGPSCVRFAGEHQRSTAYNTLGSATLVYSRLAKLGVMPHIGLINLRICAAHFAPFSTVYAWCTFQLRFLLKYMPKYFALFAGRTRMYSVRHGIWSAYLSSSLSITPNPHCPVHNSTMVLAVKTSKHKIAHASSLSICQW